jgi:hypothetical protein
VTTTSHDVVESRTSILQVSSLLPPSAMSLPPTLSSDLMRSSPSLPSGVCSPSPPTATSLALLAEVAVGSGAAGELILVVAAVEPVVAPTAVEDVVAVGCVLSGASR